MIFCFSPRDFQNLFLVFDFANFNFGFGSLSSGLPNCSLGLLYLKKYFCKRKSNLQILKIALVLSFGFQNLENNLPL